MYIVSTFHLFFYILLFIFATICSIIIKTETNGN